MREQPTHLKNGIMADAKEREFRKAAAQVQLLVSTTRLLDAAADVRRDLDRLLSLLKSDEQEEGSDAEAS